MAFNTFDDQSVKRIGEAVRKVERLGGDRNQPPIEANVVSEGFREIIRGSFSGVWQKDTEATVSYIADNGDTREKLAFNYVNDVGDASGSTNCVIMLAGSEWVLVAASLATECQEVVTSINVTETALSFLTGVSLDATGTFVTGLTGSVVSKVECINGNLTVTTTNLSDFAKTGSISGGLSATTASLTIREVGEIESQNLTLLPQGACNADNA